MTRTHLLMLAGMVALPLLTGAAGDGRPRLDLPIACAPGRTCFIQQYVDADPGPGERDYRCRDRTYDGHKGTDLRLPTIAMQRRGVGVLAAAPGIVTGARNDMADMPVDAATRATVRGRECGNGVVLRHDDGWETQYCHMAQGTVAVRAGDRVTAGQRLGAVGLSGETAFPHLHFEVRRNRATIDPFAPDRTGATCGAPAGSLWSPAARRALAYRDAEIINLGFSAVPVTQTQIEADTIPRPLRDAPAILVYARAIGMAEGDTLRLAVLRPDGTTLTTADVPMRNGRAQFLAFAGRRRPLEGWPAGSYRATATVMRGGRPVTAGSTTLVL